MVSGTRPAECVRTLVATLIGRPGEAITAGITTEPGNLAGSRPIP